MENVNTEETWDMAYFKCFLRCDAKKTLFSLSIKHGIKHGMIELQALNIFTIILYYIRPSLFTSYNLLLFSPGLACRMRRQTGVRSTHGQVSCLWRELDYMSTNQRKS